MIYRSALPIAGVVWIARHEHQTATVLADVRQRDLRLFTSGRQELVRHLPAHPAPSPVFTSLPLAPRWSRFFRTWMACAKCDVSRGLDIDHKTNAAGIVLELRS